MPGITGFIGQYITPFCSNSFTQLSNKAAKDFVDDIIQVRINAISNDIGYQYIETEQHLLILDGDIFSLDSLDCANPANLLLSAHKNGNLADCLTKANGYFNLFIYDKSSQHVTLATDRYGMKPIYVAQQENLIQGFSSELKALTLHPDISLEIDEAALNAFGQLGHMLNQQTWFKSINRIPPATIMEIELNSMAGTTQQYWSWSNISINTDISFDEATDQLYYHFDKAMQRCLSNLKQPTLAVTLSGGLDSRVILAAAKQHFNGKIKTFTFGNPDCDDATIAKQVAKLAKVENELRTIDAINWFDGRENGVWKTDGMFNVLHMHALGSAEDIATDSNYLLNGYLGDAVIGGSYLVNNHLEQGTSPELLAKRYPSLVESIELNHAYFGSTKHDPIFIYNRGVRFIATGTDLLSSRLHNLKPFMDYDLIDFSYSLPDAYRFNSRIYNAMLLKYYPMYFKDIPWQQTGKPISIANESGDSHQNVSVKRKLINLVKASPLAGIAHTVYRKINASKGYTSYTDWMQQPQFKSYANQLLMSEDAAIQQLISKEDIAARLAHFYKMKPNNAESIGALLTLAIYLEQLSKFRSINES
ncbi:asparagine synthase-related protein [Shewanella waksmanii]|uniref:asparagine synthase-related protein n=1 Tax=Shewanella waksmanii TaxID=213783 RepID=UPI003735C7F3